jgi:hypothetical protein
MSTYAILVLYFYNEIPPFEHNSVGFLLHNSMSTKTFYKEQVAKSHFLLTMYLNDALAHPECKGAYQAIQVMKNCVEDAYSQILGGEGFDLNLEFNDEDED